MMASCMRQPASSLLCLSSLFLLLLAVSPALSSSSFSHASIPHLISSPLTIDNITSIVNAHVSSSLLSAPLSTPALLPSPAAADYSAAAVSASAPVILSVSGCALSLNSTTRGCNFSSVLTITGSNLSNVTLFQLGGVVNCSVPPWQVADDRVTAAICPYYYPPVLLDLRVLTSDGQWSAPLGNATYFGGSVNPVITALNGCQMGASACDWTRNHTLTIAGRNFILSQAFYLAVVFPTQTFLSATCRLRTPTQLVCVQLPLPYWPQSTPPDPTERFPICIFVFGPPNWLQLYINSNYYRGIAFTSPATLPSSSTGSGGDSRVPFIQIVSGCEDDEAFGRTLNCPFSTNLTLTIIGHNFLEADISSVRLNSTACTEWRIVKSTELTCSVYFPLPSPPPALQWLSVSINSSHGLAVFDNSVTVNTEVLPPVITGWDGCPPPPGGCNTNVVISIQGENFPRWLDAFLLIDPPLFTISCQFPERSYRLQCPLSGTDWDKGPQRLRTGVQLPFRIRFGDVNSGRESDDLTLMFGSNSLPPTGSAASGGGGGNGGDSSGAVDDADLDGMKIALMVLMVISLSVLTVATVVWAVTWWHAHRRAYVSSHGAAAVDMRQVLLHGAV